MAVLSPLSAWSALPWHSADAFRYAEVHPDTNHNLGFTLLSGAETGISFTNFLSDERGLTNQIYLNGSGIALGDVDGDGWCDLYLGSIDGKNALYRNRGNWRFEDITEEAGVSCAGIPTTGVLFADVDGDGDLDLLVNSIGRGTLIFLNDGHGRFTDVTARAGTAARTGSMSAAMADVDGDGLLDLYVANYRTSTLRDEPFTRFTITVTNGQHVVAAVNGKPATSPELFGRFTVNEHGGIVEHGEPDVLFHNLGGGRFNPVPWANGAFLDEDGNRFAVPFDFGLSVMMRDLNGDGAPDIYVCNDFDSEDRVWINRGNGAFRLMPRLGLRQTSLFSMGVDVADINRDGLDDIFVADMLSREHVRRMVQLGDRRANAARPGVFDDRPQYMRNTLFLNRGDGTYAEIARFAGVEASEWSWTPAFLDVDLDGYEDLLISNGHLRDGQNLDYIRRIQASKRERPMSAIEQLRLRKIFPPLNNNSVAFRNRGDLRFEEISAAWHFNAAGVKQGMALADLDNDGDLDVVVGVLNGSPLVYRNDAAAPRIAVRLKGQAPNTFGVGAKINVRGGPVAQSQQMVCGGRYLSGDDFMRVFAAGRASSNLTIEVTWRSGRHSIVSNAQANCVYEIEEPPAPAQPRTGAAPSSAPLFRDASSLISHSHHEDEFDDFARQPLLVRRLSQPGPGVSWFDLDGDGFDDLIIGSGTGGNAAAFHNDGRGGFERIERKPFSIVAQRDQTAVVGVELGGRRIVLTGLSNYEDGQKGGGAVKAYDYATSNLVDELAAQESSAGPLALADVDGDGELDLFVGGRVIPGRYPQPASSLLLRGVRGQWVLDRERSAVFENIGLVTSAVFSDIDGDGAPDLVLACEWGPIRLFRNEHGVLKPWNMPLRKAGQNSQPASLSQLTGWWTSVVTGDFDGDGRVDIVAGNWGENAGYRPSFREPLHVYFGDFNDDGVFDLLEAESDAALGKIVPVRDPLVVFRALPSLAVRYPTLEAYGRASVTEVIGKPAGIQELSATTLQSMLFLNLGTNFEARSLPRDAQLSPVFGIGVADFDGDGREDLILAQNFFGVDGITSRSDAGRGLFLRGNGGGDFRAVPGQESGIAVYGEGRGVAVCDYDGDGRVDVCIGQTGAQTKLYHNDRAPAGLRVRLKGPPQNPHAIGAMLRPILTNKTFGAAREIHAGSGWLSQDSAVQVIANRDALESIFVRWPGGKTTTSRIPREAREIEIAGSGDVAVRR